VTEAQTTGQMIPSGTDKLPIEASTH
jgi:hypothetical protein